MIKLVYLYFLSMILCYTITWNGNKDTYWNNIDNWNPKKIPTMDDNVIILYNASIPPYSDQDIYANELYNYLIIDLYKTTAIVNKLYNYGQINIYNSTMISKDIIKIVGHIDVVDGTLIAPLIVMDNNSLIHGGGYINSSVNNIDGQLIIYQNSELYINDYTQQMNATLSYFLNKNLLITNNLYLSGKIKVYQPYLSDNTTDTIIKSKNMIVNDTYLDVCNHHTKGELIINNNTIKVFLKKY